MTTTEPPPPTAADCVARAADLLRQASAHLDGGTGAERYVNVAAGWRDLGATIAANPPAFARPTEPGANP